MYTYMPIVQTGRSRGFISTESPEPGYLAVCLCLDPSGAPVVCVLFPHL